MTAAKRRTLILPLLSCALAVSLAANALLYRESRRPLFEPGDEPLIARTASLAMSQGARADEGMRDFFPIVMRLADRTCVELRSRRGLGHVGACYDRRTGALVGETASVVDRARRTDEAIEDLLRGLFR